MEEVGELFTGLHPIGITMGDLLSDAATVFFENDINASLALCMVKNLFNSCLQNVMTNEIENSSLY